MKNTSAQASVGGNQSYGYRQQRRVDWRNLRSGGKQKSKTTFTKQNSCTTLGERYFMKLQTLLSISILFILSWHYLHEWKTTAKIDHALRFYGLPEHDWNGSNGSNAFILFQTVVPLKAGCFLSFYLAYHLYFSQQNSQRLFPMLHLSSHAQLKATSKTHL